MKKVLILSMAVLMLFVITATVQAAENNWRFRIRADDNQGYYYSDSQVGMYPTSSDLYDSQDSSAQFFKFPDGTAYACWATTVIPGRTETFMKDIKAPIEAGQPVEKKWDLRIAVMHSGTNPYIRLNFLPISTLAGMAPPSQINGVPVQYYIKMVDNRGVEGAPANGTEWIIPSPTIYNTTVPFFSLVLPTGFTGTNGPNDIMVTDSLHEYVMSEGYVMEYGLRPVPEPSTMLALGTGVSGIAGFIIRRRKSQR